MINDIQKQYDRMYGVHSIMLRMKEVYVVPDWYIRYTATKAFFETKMAEGSSVYSHGIKILSLAEKLEHLKVGLDNDTYIDVILQSLPPSYDSFIVNYNMSRLEKSIHELINMLVQYKVMNPQACTGGIGRRDLNFQDERQEGRMLEEEEKKGKDHCSHCQRRGAPGCSSRKGQREREGR
ncbi:UNVERIFIED_CONTAM: hypothetical protein Sradi_7132700 [Sesamum radiatum]|uniref:Uncharacterized protein n=1 Tax=Sesamum radiatum TaxID=300843 RepID=A0AAW2J023_SESRA